MKTSIRNWLVVVTTILLATITSFAGNFQKGNIAVYRIGDGVESFATSGANAAGNTIYIDEYTPGGTLVQSVKVDNSGSTAIITGGSSSGLIGYLDRSPDNHLVVFCDYHTNIASGVANLNNSASATVWRAVGTVNQSGTYAYVSGTTNLGATYPRSAATDGNGKYWASAAVESPVYFSTIFGAGVAPNIKMPTMTTTSPVNLRNLKCITTNSVTSLFFTAATGSFVGVCGLNPVLPTANGAVANQMAFAGGSSGAAPGNSIEDFSIDPTGSTMYLAVDNTTGANGGGVQKWTQSAGVWTLGYTILQQCRGLCVDWSGTPVIYVTTSTTANNAVLSFADPGSGIAPTATTVATSGALRAFRGITMAPYGAPVITTQPGGQTVTAGNPANYSVVLAAGTDTTSITYVWKDNLGATLASHTTSLLTDSFTFSSPQVSDSGKSIHVEVSNSLGNVASSGADLIVNAAGQPPTINFDIFADQAPIYVGQTLHLTVDVFGTTPMTYSWTHNGANAVGGHVSQADNGLESVLTITGVQTSDAGTYYVGITNSFSPGTSSTLAIDVITPNPPAITAMNPTGNITNNAAGTRNLSVGASDDSGVLTYQWKHGAANLSNGAQVNGATVAGATTANLTLTGVLGGDDGSYHCIVANANGAQTSDSSAATIGGNPGTAVLYVNDPIVTAQPTSKIVVEGGTINETVFATGTGMTFQWSKDGNPLSDGGTIAGASTTALTVSSAQASDAGQYTVAVSGTYGTPATTPATIVIAKTTPQAIAATNLVVLQRGDGVEPLSANGNSLFLVQYDPNGNLVSAFQVPNTGVNSLIQAGNTPTEGWLTKSSDGSKLVFAGYATALAGAPSLATSSGATVNRGVGTLDATGAYSLAAKGTNHSGSNIRSATADAAGNYFTAGANGGIEAYLNGNPNGVQIWTQVGNNRVVNNFNGNLYLGTSTVIKQNGADSTSGADGVYAFSGFPTTLQTSPATNGWYIKIPTNQVDVGIYDFAISPDDSVAYVTDDQGFAAPDQGGIHRFDKSGGVWSYSYRIGQASRGLTVDWTGVNPVIYATTPSTGTTNGNNFANAGNDIVKVVDTGANSTITTIASAIGGSAAGIRMAPGVSQTISFPQVPTQFSCAGPIPLGATASSSLPVSYTVEDGPATIVGGNLVLTTPISSVASIDVIASQAGDATYSPAQHVVMSFLVNPSSPSIQVTGSDPATAECHGGYIDAGATATDSCGNSLSVTPTNPVDANSVGTYTVTYSATDASSGVTSTATRVVNVNDTVAPQIVVLGSNPTNICQNSVYTDAGATANDDCTGPVTPSVSSSVDTSTLGTYTVTYTATDGTNPSVAYRVVNVVDCGVHISLQPQNQLKQLQGTNVALSVAATGPDLQYQWYENSNAVSSVANPTAITAAFSFNAHTNIATKTNVYYYAVVSNGSSSQKSSVALVTVVIDKGIPVLTIHSPANNARTNHFAITGTATDSTPGNAARLIYHWTGVTVPGSSPNYTNDFGTTGAPMVTGTPTSRTLTALTINNPPSPGTNTLEAWVEDLEGHASAHKVLTLFWQVPHNYALTIGGDGTGTLAVTTHGGPHEVIAGAPATPTTILVGGSTASNLTLYAYQFYSFKFTPSPNTNKPPGVSSVVSNVVFGVSTNKPQTIAFQALDTDDSKTVFFNRNRLTDMAGSYSGVFSETNNPSVASSGLLSMTVMANGKIVAKLANNNVLPVPTIHGNVQSDGTVGGTDGTYTIAGILDWANSQTNGGVKQFIGTISTSGWTSDVTADRFEKLSLTATSKRTMVIPSFAGGPTGDSYATITDSANARTFHFTLADDEIPVAGSVTVNATASGNFGIYLYPHFKSGDASKAVLFGTWNTNSGNQVTLHWVKQSGGSLVSTGFTNAPVASIAGVTNGLTGQHTVGITNGVHALSFEINFDTLSKVSGPTNHITIVKTATGVYNVTFNNGNATGPKTTTGHAAELEDAQTGGGFYLPTPTGSTDSGIISIGPKE